MSSYTFKSSFQNEYVEIENALKFGYSWYDIVEREFARMRRIEQRALNTPAQFVQLPSAEEIKRREMRKTIPTLCNDFVVAVQNTVEVERTFDVLVDVIVEVAKRFPASLQEEVVRAMCQSLEEKGLVPVAQPVAPAVPIAPIAPIAQPIAQPVVPVAPIAQPVAPVAPVAPIAQPVAPVARNVQPYTLNVAPPPTVMCVRKRERSMPVRSHIPEIFTRLMALESAKALQSSNPFDWIVRTMPCF